MNSLNFVSVLEAATEAAKRRSIVPDHLRETAQQVVLVDYKSTLAIPGFGKFPGTSVARTHYSRQYLAEFLYGKEYLGNEGKGMYGIAMYCQYDSSLSCDSILFNEVNHEPFFIEGREVAKRVVADEALQRDKSTSRNNVDTILEHGFIEESVLNAILGELMRAKPQTTPITIGAYSDGIRLLHDDYDVSGRSLCVPKGGFVCRDAAAGMLLQEIAYALDDTRREQSVPAEGYARSFELVLS